MLAGEQAVSLQVGWPGSQSWCYGGIFMVCVWVVTTTAVQPHPASLEPTQSDWGQVRLLKPTTNHSTMSNPEMLVPDTAVSRVQIQ